MGWIIHVANAPEIPPIPNGAKELSKPDEFTRLDDCDNEVADVLLVMDKSKYIRG